MFKSLVKVQLLGLLEMFSSKNRRKNRTSSKGIGGAIAILALIFVCLSVYSFSFFMTTALTLKETENYWLCFAFYFIIAFLFMILGSLFMTKNILFEAKDNDLLLSLPIPTNRILLSRIIVLLIFDYFYELAMGLSVFVAYLIIGSPTAVGIIGFIVTLITLPLFAFALTALLAWLVSILMRKVRNKSMVTIVFSLIAFILYFCFCFNSGTLFEKIINNHGMLAESLGKFLPVKWLGLSIAQPNALYSFAFNSFFIVFSAASFALICKTFIKTVTTKSGFKRKTYKAERIKARPVNSALLAREFKHLFSSPAYFLNACLSVIIMLIADVFLIVQAIIPQSFLSVMLTEIASEISARPTAFLSVIAILLNCGLLGLALVTPPSVSIEGKNLWILKCMPITPKQIFNAKLLVQIILTLPVTVLFSLGAVILIKPTFTEGLFIFVTPIAYAVFIDVIGLVEGIRHPVMDWSNEAVAVKTGYAVLFTMLIGIGAIIPPVAAGLPLTVIGISPVFALAIYTVLLLVASVLLYRYLSVGGARKLNEL